CFDHYNGSLTSPMSGSFGRILDRNPDLFLHLGDLHYADNSSTSQASHRANIESVLAASGAMRQLLASVPTVYVKSDHDAGGGNNAYPGSYTAPSRAAAKEVFPYRDLPVSDGLYHAFTVG